MNRESHRDTPTNAELPAATIIDSNLEVQAECERTRHVAYERAQELLQRRIDKYSAAAPKPRLPGAAFQGFDAPQALAPEMLLEYKALADMKAGKGTDDEVRTVLVSEREKAKALIESEEKRMSTELNERMHGRGPAIKSEELLAAGPAWENSPAKTALVGEIAELNRLISSLAAAN